MVSSDALSRIRNGVCAIGYLTIPLADYAKSYELPGLFKVVGTGFLIAEGTVITNRHVIDELYEEIKRNSIPTSQLFLSFVVPRTTGTGPLGITVRMIRHTGTVRNGQVDIGFIRFEVVHPEHFQDIIPVPTESAFSITVSESVAVFGYPHGSALLENDGKLRWGPVLQQGWISGVAPYDGAKVVDEMLLDLRADEGMSGSPIFRPSSGAVVGILQGAIKPGHTESSLGTTTVFGIPLDSTILAQWLVQYQMSATEDS